MSSLTGLSLFALFAKVKSSSTNHHRKHHVFNAIGALI
jgi:hypothetical protein